MSKKESSGSSRRQRVIEPDETFNFAAYESYWQKFWSDHPQSKSGDRKKFYALSMFPYPSGVLHFGHALPYTIIDSLSRYKRMQGFDVLCPMGWDAFGLPAENAAIEAVRRGEANVHPKTKTLESINHMREQMHKFGYGFNWEREIFTCKPDYYKWTQWIFQKMLEKDVAYRKKARVNWCPSCKTVLANEQVETIVKEVEEFQGCFRCGSKVEPKEIDAWFLRITSYADRLLDELAPLEKNWSELVVSQQRNWIGRSEGVNIDFTVELHKNASGSGPLSPPKADAKPAETAKLTVFTTRADTVFGVTFVAIAPEHPLVKRILELVDPRTQKRIHEFIHEALSMTEMDRASGDEKEGVNSGMYAVNPLNGERVPLFIANYVLMYGTGAVMAVPAHDERDHDFARGYRLGIKQVIEPTAERKKTDTGQRVDVQKAAFTEPGVLVNSGRYSGQSSADAMANIAADLKKSSQGGRTVNYKLRDWGISRQRYWGCPIPVVHCATCGIVPVPESELPVLLPDDVDFLPTGQSPLTLHPSFQKTKCPRCGRADARRDTDTMDTFVDSSWYWFRYTDPKNDKAIFDQDKVNHWCPVDLYVGGREHAILHLIYARFYCKFLHDIGLVAHEEPFTRMFTHGLIQGESLKVVNDHMSRYVNAETLEQLIAQGKAKPEDVSRRIEKMSKSKHNGADPTELVRKFGADTVRMYVLFLGPAEQDSVWDPNGILGAHRFIKRWHESVLSSAPLVENLPDMNESCRMNAAATTLRHGAHSLIEKSTQEYEGRYAFNTVIAKCMELVNSLRAFIAQEKLEGLVKGATDPSLASRWALSEAFSILNRVLAPIAPHTAEEANRALGHTGSIFDQPWPKADPQALLLDEIELPVQVNGKVRGTIRVPREADQKALEAAALANEGVRKLLDGKQIRKLIAVPGKIVNVVVA